MIWYRHCDARYPFLWADSAQPPARWHGPGEGPANYFADTPDGAWAEFLRHEEIVALEDLAGISRAIWAVDVRIDEPATPTLPRREMIGDEETYSACQQEARKIRLLGHTSLLAPSAALKAGEAAGWSVEHGEYRRQARDGTVLVAYGPPTRNLEGWQAAVDSRPPVRVLMAVRHFDDQHH